MPTRRSSRVLEKAGADLKETTEEFEKRRAKANDAASKTELEVLTFIDEDAKVPPAPPLALATQKRKMSSQNDPDYSPTGNNETKEDALTKQKRISAEMDLDNIVKHWKEWLKSDEIDIKTLQEPKQEASKSNEDAYMMVPMYLGALNNNIRDTGMVSFMRRFALEAHQEFHNELGDQLDTTMEVDAHRNVYTEKYGCAFVIFQTTMSTKQHLQDSRIDVLNTTDVIPVVPEYGTVEKYPGAGELNFGTQIKNKSAVVCVYDPVHNRGVMKGDVPGFKCYFTSSADKAIEYVWKKWDKMIKKFSVLGYGMLEAGLTVQTYIKDQDRQGGKHTERMFCPQYVALATSDDAPLDSQLQIAGRSFVDLKNQSAPPHWRIKLLGVKGRIESLQNYSSMEKRFADIGRDEDEGQMRMFEALKRGFGTRIVGLNSLKTLGVLGVRRGEFSRILGLTPAAVDILIGKVEETRSRFKDKTDNEETKRKWLNDALDQEDADEVADLLSLTEAGEEDTTDDTTDDTSELVGADIPMTD